MKNKYLLSFSILMLVLSSCSSSPLPNEKKIPLEKNDTYQRKDNQPYDTLEYPDYSHATTVKEALVDIQNKKSMVLYFYSSTCPSCLEVKPLFLKYICETHYVFDTLEVYSEGNSVEEIIEGFPPVFEDMLRKDEDNHYHVVYPFFYFILEGELVASSPVYATSKKNYRYFASFLNGYVKSK